MGKNMEQAQARCTRGEETKEKLWRRKKDKRGKMNKKIKEGEVNSHVRRKTKLRSIRVAPKK